MGFRAGISHESIIYSISNSLPITFVVENNEKSVGTPTEASWGPEVDTEALFKVYEELAKNTDTNMIYYKYQMSYPHSGTGVFVEF